MRARLTASLSTLPKHRKHQTGVRLGLITAAASVLALAAPPAMAAGGSSTVPRVLHVQQIARQDVPALPGSEPDTLVEPDVAVSPIDADVAVAAAHDGRYPDGGAVGIDYAWTHDGGATWHHQPVPQLTAATGGPAVWQRASDPVVAFGPDGAAYISTLVFNTGCDTAVAVSRSTDGGRTFAAPVLAHRSSTCDISDDKNWLVVDTSARSPHRGRIYQFWTPFLTDIFGHDAGYPQALVWSDDHGRTWSRPVNVTRPRAHTQDSQPMLQPDGTIVDAYLDFGAGGSDEGSEAQGARHGHHAVDQQRSQARPQGQAPAAAAVAYPVFRTSVSTDGGQTWRAGGTITSDLGGPAGVRCCLPSAVADPVTGSLHAAWNAADATKVELSSSRDGRTWSPPVVVNRPSKAWLTVNADVSAYAGRVSVSYGLTNADASAGHFGRQYVATSRDSGAHFAPATAVGPRIDYAYAAHAGGIFPGDYIGSAMTRTRLYTVWAVASAPPRAGAPYHQVIYGATLNMSKTVAAP